MRLAKFNPNHDKRNGRFTRRSEPSAQKAPGYAPTGGDLGDIFLDTDKWYVSGGNRDDEELAYETMRFIRKKLNSVLTLGTQNFNQPGETNIITGERQVFVSIQSKDYITSPNGELRVRAGVLDEKPSVVGLFLSTNPKASQDVLHSMALHEMGHFVDCILQSEKTGGATPLATRSIPSDPDVFDVLKTIRESPSIDRLIEDTRRVREKYLLTKDVGPVTLRYMSGGEHVIRPSDGQDEYRVAVTKTLAHNDYLLDPAETFARAFEQWIYLKTENKTISSHRSSSDKTIGDFAFPQYPVWPDEEFKPIAEAMDNLFRSRRMLKQ